MFKRFVICSEVTRLFFSGGASTDTSAATISADSISNRVNYENRTLSKAVYLHILNLGGYLILAVKNLQNNFTPNYYQKLALTGYYDLLKDEVVSKNKKGQDFS